MRPARETIMTALYNALTASVMTSFTADTTENSPVLSNPSTQAGLFIGLPVFGGSIPRGAVISALSPLTLSANAKAAATAAALTTGFLTTGRRLKKWSEVSAQPALFLRDGTEQIEYGSTLLPILTMRAEIWIYSNAGLSPDVVPVTALNNLLDAVQSVFNPDMPGTARYTLGGLVEWCRIAGEIEKDPGDISGQAIALADVEIIVP